MGNYLKNKTNRSQRELTVLEKWNEHIKQRNQRYYDQAEYFEYFNPMHQIQIAIKVIQELDQKQNILKYCCSNIVEYLRSQDPNKYVGEIAIQVFLGQTHFTEFAIPQAQSKKEEAYFVLIAKHQMIRDIARVWADITINKYTILDGSHVRQMLDQRIEGRQLIYEKLCQDLLEFKQYIEEILYQIFKKIENTDNLQKLVIKIILSKKRLRDYIYQIFDLYSTQQTEELKIKLNKFNRITLQQLKIKEQFQHCSFQLTLNQLKQILKVEHPCDKFELFYNLDQKMIQDIQSTTNDLQQIELDIDKQIIFLIILVNQEFQLIVLQKLIVVNGHLSLILWKRFQGKKQNTIRGNNQYNLVMLYVQQSSSQKNWIITLI